MRRGAFCGHRSAEMGGVVPLTELSAAQRCAGLGLRGIRARRPRRHQRRDHQVRFITWCAAGILRQMRVELDLRKRAAADGNTFSRRCLRSGGTAPAEEADIPGGALAWLHLDDF